jgi:hypothetical protein
MTDLDPDRPVHLVPHDLAIAGVEKVPFDAPFEAVIGIDCESNCQILFSAALSYDQIAPGAIKYRISAAVADVALCGQLFALFVGDALLLFFESRPEFRFNLVLELGSEEKLIDQGHVRDFLTELLDRWLSLTMLDGNALRIPFGGGVNKS